MQVYYFTRTGRSRKIAEEFAARRGVSPRVIRDGKNWNGPIGWLKAVFYGVNGKGLPADYERPAHGETVAVVFPVWADGIPPAVRTFMQEVGRDSIIAVPTSLSSTLKDRDGFQKIVDLVGKEISAPGDILC